MKFVLGILTGMCIIAAGSCTHDLVKAHDNRAAIACALAHNDQPSFEECYINLAIAPKEIEPYGN